MATKFLAPDHDVVVLEQDRIAGNTIGKASEPVSIAYDYIDYQAAARYALGLRGAYDDTGEFEHDRRSNVKYLPTTDHGTYTFRSVPAAPSTVSFPGRRRGGARFDDTIPMGDPDESVPTASPFAETRALSWETVRERFADAGTVSLSDETEIDARHVDLTIVRDLEASVEAADPTTATARSRANMDLDYGSEHVSIVATNRITQSNLQLTTRVVDGDPFFEKTWTRPREERRDAGSVHIRPIPVRRHERVAVWPSGEEAF